LLDRLGDLEQNLSPMARRTTARPVKASPLVGIIMGSQTDWDTLRPAAELLEELGVPFEAKIVSAHRTPDWMFKYAGSAEERGLKVIIAGAGGAAHLPGMVASKTQLPVIGVPVPATALQGVDALLSILQMPKGTPVATMAIGKPGAANAALFAMKVLALGDAALGSRLASYKKARTEEVLRQEPR
jgi:5-(carboxyamino)imidazole ribonucleotide mutase